MISIEVLSKNITKTLKKKLELDEEKAIIVEYGLYAFFYMGFSIFMVIIFGAIFNVMIEALLISFIISIFRKFSGGAHATTPISCAIIGVFISVLPAFIIPKININMKYILIFGGLVFFISMILTYMLAPVDSINKPIRKKEKIKRLKRGSIIILIIYYVLVTLNVWIYYLTKNEIFLVYIACIYTGIIWQVFTLTKMGHVVIKIIDRLMIEILNVGRNFYEKVK